MGGNVEGIFVAVFPSQAQAAAGCAMYDADVRIGISVWHVIIYLPFICNVAGMYQSIKVSWESNGRTFGLLRVRVVVNYWRWVRILAITENRLLEQYVKTCEPIWTHPGLRNAFKLQSWASTERLKNRECCSLGQMRGNKWMRRSEADVVARCLFTKLIPE